MGHSGIDALRTKALRDTARVIDQELMQRAHDAADRLKLNGNGDLARRLERALDACDDMDPRYGALVLASSFAHRRRLVTTFSEIVDRLKTLDDEIDELDELLADLKRKPRRRRAAA